MKNNTATPYNVVISYRNIYIALAVSLAVVAVLYYLKYYSSYGSEGFISFASLRRKANNQCKPATNEINRGRTNQARTIQDFDKFRSKERKIKLPPCVYIKDKTARLAYEQEQLILNIRAENFMKIFNDNSESQAKNDSNRAEFITYLANALYLSNIPEESIGNFQGSLLNKNFISLAEAKRLLNQYPVLKPIIDSFVKVINDVNQTAINNVVENNAEFTPVNYLPDGTVSSSAISRQRRVIAPEFKDLAHKTSALNTEACGDDDSCVYGAKIDEDPAMAKWQEELSKRYSSNLAVNILDTYNTAFKQSAIVNTINKPMIPLTPAEVQTYQTAKCRGSDIIRSFS